MAQAPKFSTQHDVQTYDALYEQDARASAVDAYTTSHLLSEESSRHHAALDQIYHDSLAAGLPDISCSPSQAKFLMLQCRMLNAKHVLEVGTLGGYSAAWMATAGPNIKITTLELDKQHVAVATKNLAQAGLSSQVEILQGAAMDVLPGLVAKVQSGQRPPIEFAFIDANKEENLAYFNYALSMTGPNAAIVVDNVVRNGKVASAAAAETDTRIMGTRKLIEAIGQNERVDATVIQTVGEKNYDGFLLAVKR